MAEEKKDLTQREPPIAPDAEAQRLAAEKALIAAACAVLLVFGGACLRPFPPPEGL